MNITEITKRENDLICLYNDAKEANKQLAEAIQYAAQQADTTPAVVRRYITALASEKTNTVIAETEQLTMLFQALPTVQDQVAA